jgi:hypothetical protein
MRFNVPATVPAFISSLDMHVVQLEKRDIFKIQAITQLARIASLVENGPLAWTL